MSKVTLSPKSARAASAYTIAKCIKAFRMNVEGNGARTVGYELDLTSRQADSAIDAGREYVTFTTGNDDLGACDAALSNLTVKQLFPTCAGGR